MSNEEVGNNDLSEEELNELLDSGDVDRIDAYLSGEPTSKSDGTSESSIADDDDTADDKEAEVKKVEKTETELATEKANEAEGNPKPEDDDAEKVIKSKSGKHEYPYSVLVKEREEKKQLKAQLDAATKVADNLKQQLSRNKIEPEDLPENVEFTEEKLAYYDDIDPELGRGFRALAAKVAGLEAQRTGSTVVTSASAQEADITQAIEQNESIDRWRNSDPDAWKIACDIDNQLQKDPDYSSLPLDKYFEEVARRTEAKLKPAQKPAISDEEAARLAAEKVERETSAQIPKSLTDVGRTPSQERTFNDRAEDMSTAEIADNFENMTSAQIEQALANSA